MSEWFFSNKDSLKRNKRRLFFQTLSIQILFNSSFISNNFLQFIQIKYLQPVKEIDQSAIRYEKVISFTTTCQLQNNYIFRTAHRLATSLKRVVQCLFIFYFFILLVLTCVKESLIKFLMSFRHGWFVYLLLLVLHFSFFGMYKI